MFNISKKSFYYSKDPDESLELKYKFLKSKILKIIENNPAYGYRRIKKALFDEYNEVVNHKLLLKLLKLWGLLVKRTVRKPSKSWIHSILDYLQLRANLLWQLSKKGLISRCFQIIVSDITEIKYQDKKAYLCVHLDHYGKMIYGWKLSSNPNTELVLDSFFKACNKIKKILNWFPNGIIIHQDRGSVYTSAEYISKILNKKCLLSYSRTGEPGDNAVNESFFSRLKDEWRDVFSEARNFEELNLMVEKAIDYYNNKRYHSTIGMVAPAIFMKEQVNELIKFYN